MREPTRQSVAGMIFAALLALALQAGCERAETPHPDPEEAFFELYERPAETVVAEIGDRELSLEDFEVFWRRRPELERDEALQAFIERELLVVEAIDLGYTSREELQTPRKRAMVRALLREEIEEEITREDLDDEEIEEEVDRVRDEVGHPPGLRASHLLVAAPREQKKRATDEHLEEWSEQERNWIDQIRRELSDEASALDLFEAREAFEDEPEEPLEIHVNAHLVFPLDGEDYGKNLPEGWRPVVGAFRDAAAELAGEGRFGEVSEPVESKFGWHLIVVEESYPGARPDPQMLRELAVDRLLRERRNERLADLVDEWVEQAHIELYPELIEEAGGAER